MRRNSWKVLKKALEVCCEFYELFEKIAFAEVISLSNYVSVEIFVFDFVV